MLSSFVSLLGALSFGNKDKESWMAVRTLSIWDEMGMLNGSLDCAKATDDTKSSRKNRDTKTFW